MLGWNQCFQSTFEWKCLTPHSLSLGAKRKEKKRKLGLSVIKLGANTRSCRWLGAARVGQKQPSAVGAVWVPGRITESAPQAQPRFFLICMFSLYSLYIYFLIWCYMLYGVIWWPWHLNSVQNLPIQKGAGGIHSVKESKPCQPQKIPRAFFHLARECLPF